jgi:hypothetical protein
VSNYSVFLNVRAALLATAEETTNPPFTATGGHRHNEDFLDVICLLDPPDPNCP